MAKAKQQQSEAADSETGVPGADAKPVKQAAAKAGAAKKRAAKRPAKKVAKDVVKDVVKDVTKDVVKDVAKQPAKQRAKQPAKQRAKKPAKQGARKPAKQRAKKPVVPGWTPLKVKFAPRAGRSLVIVESPAKAKTIKKYLGAMYSVKASVGHVKDLPRSKLGVDIENGFRPRYEVIRTKTKIIDELRKAASTVEKVYLAADPDREGEAIAWHVADELRDVNSNLHRVLINEITKKGITAALAQPTKLDVQKYDAQQARRILDRLVGYQISPILWNKVKRGLSAGRVQSVAVRVIVDREAEITAFKAEEYWSVEADCEGTLPPPFTTRLHRWDGEKVELAREADAAKVTTELGSARAVVQSVERKERRKNPAAPFITSRLQQEAARKLRFTARKTMALAQRLYEGLELGEEGPVGLITYMRTDSVRLSADAVTEVREYIGERFGAAFVPDEPLVYKSAKQAQGAHEAIRPTSLKYDPDTVRRLLGVAGAKLHAKKVYGENPEANARDLDDHLRLYTLIWHRFIACQMAPAVYDQTIIDVTAGRATLRATGQVMKFAGFTRVYTESEGDDDTASRGDSEDRMLPAVAEGDPLRITAIRPEQHFTQPPPRFTEATLVKEMEDAGIGRPSTYASLLSTIQDRGYAEKRAGRFFPTELGTLVNELLVAAFPDILNVTFTAQMEQKFDEVEEGNAELSIVLRDFYKPFKEDLVRAEEQMRDVKREEFPTEHVCHKCGSPMVIKWGKNGSFLACKNYPECRNTAEFAKTLDGKVTILVAALTTEVCDTCTAPMVVKRGRFGSFLACTRYPDCTSTKPVSLGVTCPKEGCGGYMTEKRSRRGKVFFGCANYPKTKCDFVAWDRPVPEACPQCDAKFLLKKEQKRGVSLRCMSQDCGYRRQEGEQVEEDAA